MAEVGVHRDHDVVGAVAAATEHLVESGAIGATQSGLGLALQHLDTAQLAVQFAGEIGGSVRAVVVHHQHVGIGHRPHGAQERLDVVTLVVGGQDDHGMHDGPTLLAISVPGSRL